MAIAQALLRSAEVDPQADKDLIVAITADGGVRKQGQARNGRQIRLEFKADTAETLDLLVVFGADLQGQIRRGIVFQVGAAVEAVFGVFAELGADLSFKREAVEIKLGLAADSEHIGVASQFFVRVPADPGARDPQKTVIRVAPEQMQAGAAHDIVIAEAQQAVELEAIRMAKRQRP